MNFKTQYKSQTATLEQAQWLLTGNPEELEIGNATLTLNADMWLVQIECGGDVVTIKYKSATGARRSAAILAQRLADYLSV